MQKKKKRTLYSVFTFKSQDVFWLKFKINDEIKGWVSNIQRYKGLQEVKCYPLGIF